MRANRAFVRAAEQGGMMLREAGFRMVARGNPPAGESLFRQQDILS
jgi:hypothetical protein